MSDKKQDLKQMILDHQMLIPEDKDRLVSLVDGLEDSAIEFIYAFIFEDPENLVLINKLFKESQAIFSSGNFDQVKEMLARSYQELPE
ncbi:MAG TPA: hypothetical protein PLK76_03965 [bacterium]|nr:hypothetical protein [bacterium]